MWQRTLKCRCIGLWEKSNKKIANFSPFKYQNVCIKVCVCMPLQPQRCVFLLLLQLNIANRLQKPGISFQVMCAVFTYSIPVELAHVTSHFHPFLDPLLKSNLPDWKNNCSVGFPSLTNHDRENSEHTPRVCVNSRQGRFLGCERSFF